ncbi:hypothetical protein PSTG_19411, partial [Puccinia striiformis f. sp. tritici PST-78]
GPEIADAGIFADSRASTSVHELKISRSINGYPLPGGAFVRFRDNHRPVYARVGVSMISTEQACSQKPWRTLEFDFEKHKREARDAWKAKMINIKIETDGVDQSM